MIVTLGRFTDGKKEWVSLIIKNIQVAQKAAKDIMGSTVTKANLSPHPLYASKKVVDEEFFVDFGTVRTAFKDICSHLYKDEHVVMNINGGYLPMARIEWELLEETKFELGEGNLNNLIQQQNGNIEEFKRIEA